MKVGSAATYVCEGLFRQLFDGTGLVKLVFALHLFVVGECIAFVGVSGWKGLIIWPVSVCINPAEVLLWGIL